jgi:hypothetical protein
MVYLLVVQALFKYCVSAFVTVLLRMAGQAVVSCIMIISWHLPGETGGDRGNPGETGGDRGKSGETGGDRGKPGETRGPWKTRRNWRGPWETSTDIFGPLFEVLMGCVFNICRNLMPVLGGEVLYAYRLQTLFRNCG